MDTLTSHSVNHNNGMGSGENEPQKWGNVSRSAGLDLHAVKAFLHAKHPQKTACAVESQTGISKKTIEKWLDGTSQPGSDHLLRMIAHYGLGFLQACYGPTPPPFLPDAVTFETLKKHEREDEERERQKLLMQAKLGLRT